MSASSTSSHDDLNDSDIIQDDLYYYMDVIFLVEKTLFKVPRHVFIEESEVFQGMFAVPQTQGSIPDGLSNEQPLRLNGVKAKDFRNLLKFMYPRNQYGSTGPHLTSDEWISILHLATMWMMEGPKHLAITKLTKSLMDPVQKVVLARMYDVEQWLVPALHAIVQRKDPLNESDFNRLGLETLLKLAMLREQHIDARARRSKDGCTYTCKQCKLDRRREDGSLGDKVPFICREETCNQGVIQSSGIPVNKVKEAFLL